jgi:penicillin-binding protein 1A
MQQFAEESVIQHMPVIQRKLNLLLKTGGDKLWKTRENIIDAAMKSSERWKNLKEEEMKEEDIRKSFLQPVKNENICMECKKRIGYYNDAKRLY